MRRMGLLVEDQETVSSGFLVLFVLANGVRGYDDGAEQGLCGEFVVQRAHLAGPGL